MTLDVSELIDPRKEIVDFLPGISGLPNGCTVGTYSVRYPNGKKLIAYHGAREWDGIKETECSFTRVFLKTLGKRIVRRAELDSFKLSRPPIFVRPSFLPSAYYVDLKAAFPSIYHRVGWGVEYVRGEYLGISEPLIYPFSPDWKTGRSYIVTGARPEQISRRTYNGRIVTKAYPSPFSNPPLVGLVYDVLSAIGRFATYVLNAPYWNIDGGIINSKGNDFMAALLSEMKLQYTIKAVGPALVINAGYWIVGEKATARYEQNQPSKIWTGDNIPVSIQEAEWIIKRFSSYSPLDHQTH